MSKKGQPSKYLASFYANPGGQVAQGSTGSSSVQKGVPASKNPPSGYSAIHNAKGVSVNNSTAKGTPNSNPSTGSTAKGTPNSNPSTGSFQNEQRISAGSSSSGTKQFVPKVSTVVSATSSKPFPSSQKPANQLNSTAFDVDKFKKPGEFFKSSQSTSSQLNITSSQNKVQVAKRTSFGGGGSTHDMLSQSFQAIKPQMGGQTVGPVGSPSGSPMGVQNMRPTGGPSGNQRPMGGPSSNQRPFGGASNNQRPLGGPRGNQRPIGGPLGNQIRPVGGQIASVGGTKPPFGFNVKFSVTQRNSHIVMDKDVASTNALQLQWTQKMCQKKDSLPGNLDKRNLTRNEGKSPLGKSFWADSSFSKSKETCKNQQNDPWYSNDVWGDDLPEEAVDACLQLATQKAQQPGTSNDPLSSWMDETWASPKKASQQATGTSGRTSSVSVKTSLFTDSKFQPSRAAKSENLMDLLGGDEDFLALVDKVEPQPEPASTANKSASTFSLSGKVSFPSQAPRPTMPSLSQVRKIVPFSERLPIGAGNKGSFVVKAKEYESPSKQETLTHSQRTFRKPVKSLPSPSTTKMSFTTEWLRGQLEKISSEYTTLKEDVQVKEGESKLLREKLKTAEEEAQKHKLDKARELEHLRQDYEAKVKHLEKQLEATQTQAMFKAKEAESSLEKYRELKNISVLAPEPAKCQSFKNIPSIGPKPGVLPKVEVLADETIFVEEIDKLETAASADFINDTVNIFETPEKVIEPSIEVTPEKSMFEESPAKPKEEVLPPPMLPEPKTPPKTYVLPKKSIFDRSYIKQNEVFRKAAAQVVHGNQPKKELNHFLMPPMEYLPHTLLQTEFSEQEVENYLVRRPTLVELWDVPYDAFGTAVLDEYEKAAVGDIVPADPARIILSKSRYFTSLDSVHGYLVSLADSICWGPPEWKMAKSVVDLATSMVRELYATLGDPRLLRTTYTIYDRDPKILREFLDSSELIEMFDPLSPEKWKNESFVELRRCLVMIGFLCSVDHMTARYIVNPKSYNTSRAREFYQTSLDLSQASRKSEDDNFAVKITVKEGERKPSELKLMQMYRDLHSKKLTLAADLANSFTSSSQIQPAPPKVTFELTVPMEVDPEYENNLLARKALQSALESSEKNSVLRSGSVSSHRKCVKSTTVRFDEFKKYVSAFGLPLEGSCMQDVVGKIQGDLNPEKVVMLKNITIKAESDESKAIASYHVNVPERLFEALKCDVLEVTGDYGILGAPVDRCITLLEKRMMQLALLNSKSLKNIFERTVGDTAHSDLDLTRYVSSYAEADADYEMSRKRKVSVEDPEPRKAMKLADYETPPFDKTLYSQIQKEPEDDDVIMITETQQGPSSPVEDDQLAKFEKREEMAELKRKMLAEEKKESKRHALAPVRIPGRNSPTNEDSADREVAMEIEKMFQTQVRPDLQMDQSVWSSESEDEESEIRTLSANEDDAVIEVIPDLVKHFHNKLKNAGLLELLCEVFKEGGVLRFTHRLNGVMLGTVIMLQKIVMYQRKEIEPCQSKLATIIREILYTRPSPRIVLEVNILLRYAVTLPGFPKMLCHNASPETFVTSNELVYFTRGACLLEVVCILVTYATEEDTDYSVYLEMIHWVYYIICTEKKHMASLYEQHNADRRRCMCVTALNNTMVMIFHRALSFYRRLTDTRTNSRLKRHMQKIFTSGLQVLRLVYTYGPLSFLYTIRTQYLEYRQLLTWLREMHHSAIYKEFHLSQAYLYIVTELLKDNRDPNNLHASPEPKEQPNLENYFSHGKSWPYDEENTESSIKADSSESEDE